MKNLNIIKERYMKETPTRRIGHLASDLARISAFLDNPKNIAAVEDILEESKYFIEWAVHEAPLQTQQLFSVIQPKLALWHLHIRRGTSDAPELQELKRKTKSWSIRLLRLSGIIAT
ncbi:MAG: hypothetical protein NC938_00820 [Candidatus Omnitrophica bacterium]|nr:hypothetical protein [Candidatus Omnitrophota bacterium]